MKSLRATRSTNSRLELDRGCQEECPWLDDAEHRMSAITAIRVDGPETAAFLEILDVELETQVISAITNLRLVTRPKIHGNA